MITNCSKCDCAKSQCGCDDRGLTTNPPCTTGTPTCPNPEPCAETWSDCCVIHNGDSITYNNEGPDKPLGFTILQGERMCDTWQKLIAYFTCRGDVSQIIYGLKSTNITSTTITIAWTPLTVNINNYVVQMAPVSTGVFVNVSTVSQSTSPSLTITGLTPNTSYYIRVAPIIGGLEKCPSVSLIITTKLV
jgi:hypothetical protein